MSNISVSIVIAAFNAERFIIETVDSALAQECAETIVVDDGSIDATPQILAHYGRRIRTIRQENGGACRARNRGLAAANGNYIKFLDADDVLAAGSIARQVAAAEGFGADARVAVFEGVAWMSEDGTAVEVAAPPDPPNSHSLDEMIAWTIAHAPLTACPLHRRVDIEAIGGFDPRLQRAQEHDLHVRLAISGVRFYKAPGIAYFYRQHAGPRLSTQEPGRMASGWLASNLRHYELAAQRFGGEPPPCIRQALARRLWRQGRELARLGAGDAARGFFREARRISRRDAMFGGPVYRMIASIVGPVWGERIGLALSLFDFRQLLWKSTSK